MAEFKEFPKSGQKCHRCSQDVFAYYTPCGADYTTCPICGVMDDITSEEWDEYYNGLPDGEWGLDYCAECKTIYQHGNIHAENGCTDNAYYGQLVYEFTFNGVQYKGMPVFHTYREFIDNYKSYKFSWTSPNGVGNYKYCPQASYPER